MTDNPEKRFRLAMDQLFSTKSSSPSTPAASSAGASSPLRGNSIVSSGFQNHNNASTQVTTPSSRLPQTAVSTSAVGNSSLQPLCRPWDRGDLLRRLATFKSITWFGKPQMAGPVACARRGWVNVDVDLLACEGCDARLSFILPLSWPRNQVDSAAEVFGEQLDSGHKALCAWKGNICSEALTVFPPTPLPSLVDGFHERCRGLMQLSSIPVISGGAIDTFKSLRGPQIENLLTRSFPLAMGFANGSEHATGAESGGNGHSYKSFYQAQKLIALCGWEPRLLPYTVDCEESSAPSAKISLSAGPSDGIVSRKNRDPGPTVLLVSRADKEEERSEAGHSQETKCDPASAVLDCNLCGASVGLWGFCTVPRPPVTLDAALSELPELEKSFRNTQMYGVSAASVVDGGQRHPKFPAELHEEAADATTTVHARSATPGVLNLNLTIAGGPPPTMVLIPPAFGPMPFFQPRFGQPEGSEVGDWVVSHESRGRSEHNSRLGDFTVGNWNGRPVTADSAEGTVVDNDVCDGQVRDRAESLKSRRRTESSTVDRLSQVVAVVSGNNGDVTMEMDTEVQGAHRKRRRLIDVHAQPIVTLTHIARHATLDLLCSSSVNAVDTNYLHKQENSMESVENLRQDSDGHGTTISGDNNDSGDQVEGIETDVQALQSEIREPGNGRSIQQGEPGFDKSEDVDCDDGAETNVAVISSGTGTGGAASVRMDNVWVEGSHEAEVQGEVNGADSSVQQIVSTTDDTGVIAGVTENQGIMGEFVPDKGLVSEFIPPVEEKSDHSDVRGDSHEVMHAEHSAKHCYSNKDTAEGESGESKGKRINKEHGHGVGDKETVDTTKAVILYPDISEEEATDGHMTPGAGGEGHGCTTVNGPGIELEELRIWDTETREFDPIRQHRHFCPWVNEQVAAAANSSRRVGVCGWHLTLSALYSHRHQDGVPSNLAECESIASKYRENPILSVRKSMGNSPPKRPNGSHILT